MRAHEAARLVLDFIDCRGLGVHGFSNAADRMMTIWSAPLSFAPVRASCHGRALDAEAQQQPPMLPGAF
jgi:hypothetical protein